MQIVSCPTCGRTKIDLVSLAKQVEDAVKDIDKDVKVAVMGCVVNGPGEAREADIGVAGGDGVGLIFKHGERRSKRYRRIRSFRHFWRNWQNSETGRIG